MAWFRHSVRSDGSPISYSSPGHSSQLMLKALTVSWSIAPTTAGDFTVSLDSQLGTAYDIELYEVDPSDDALTAVLLSDINLPVFVGDAITVEYANADSRVIGIQIILADT